MGAYIYILIYICYIFGYIAYASIHKRVMIDDLGLRHRPMFQIWQVVRQCCRVEYSILVRLWFGKL